MSNEPMESALTAAGSSREEELLAALKYIAGFVLAYGDAWEALVIIQERARAAIAKTEAAAGSSAPPRKEPMAKIDSLGGRGVCASCGHVDIVWIGHPVCGECRSSKVQVDPPEQRVAPASQRDEHGAHRFENEALDVVKAIKRDYAPDLDGNDGGQILAWLLDLIDEASALPQTPEETREPAREPQEWLPIASAPTDGTTVLLYQPLGAWKSNRRGIVIGTGYWHQPANPQSPGFWCGGGAMVVVRPTHWQPLPPPPGSDRSPEPERPWCVTHQDWASASCREAVHRLESAADRERANRSTNREDKEQP